MKRMIQTVLAILAIAFASSSVIAQPPGGPGGGQRDGGPPRGGQHDIDPGRSVLQALDTDGNHEISADEIANATASLKKLDANGDGKLTDDDVQRGSRGQARNRQGRQEAGNRHEGQRGRQSGRQQGQRGAGGPPSPDQFVEHAMEFDADQDGKLDASELRKFAEQMGPPQHGPRHERGREGRDGSERDRPQRPSRPDR